MNMNIGQAHLVFVKRDIFLNMESVYLQMMNSLNALLTQFLMESTVYVKLDIIQFIQENAILARQALTGMDINVKLEIMLVLMVLFGILKKVNVFQKFNAE